MGLHNRKIAPSRMKAHRYSKESIDLIRHFLKDRLSIIGEIRTAEAVRLVSRHVPLGNSSISFMFRLIMEEETAANRATKLSSGKWLISEQIPVKNVEVIKVNRYDFLEPPKRNLAEEIYIEMKAFKKSNEDVFSRQLLIRLEAAGISLKTFNNYVKWKRLEKK